MEARAVPLRLAGHVETSEEVIVLVQEKRRSSVKVDSGEGVEETALRNLGWVEPSNGVPFGRGDEVGGGGEADSQAPGSGG